MLEYEVTKYVEISSTLHKKLDVEEEATTRLIEETLLSTKITRLVFKTRQKGMLKFLLRLKSS